MLHNMYEKSEEEKDVINTLKFKSSVYVILFRSFKPCHIEKVNVCILVKHLHYL